MGFHYGQSRRKSNAAALSISLDHLLDFHDPQRIFKGLRRKAVWRFAAKLRNLCGGIGHIGRLVPPAAQGHGRHIGAIGFDQQAICGDIARHLCQLRRVFKRHRAGQGNVQSEVQIDLCALPTAARLRSISMQSPWASRICSCTGIARSQAISI